MTEHLGEDELLELASGDRSLGASPALEAHLADCAPCSTLLCTLLDTEPAPRDLVARRLGPYRLDAKIGAGGMGEVYRAWDERLQRTVAVKVVSERVETEARAAAAIAHPNVVTVFDTGVHDGVAYVVCELIDGETLKSRIERDVPRALALALVIQLCRGVAAAHAVGVVHRDLKPSNLLVTDDGTLKILDFGLAQLAGDTVSVAVGTAGYSAPEQVRAEPADARSDVFAIGAIAYELLARRPAFPGATYADRVAAVLRAPPPPLDDPAGAAITRSLDPDPRKRFQSAADLAWVLERLDAPRPPAPSRRAFVLGLAATGAGGVALGRLLRSPPSAQRVPAFQQLTFRQGRVGRARFTQDGGTLVYSAAFEDHPLAVFAIRLDGGGARALQLPPAQILAVSARGQLALSLDHRYIDGFHQRGELALAPLEGGEPRRLGIAVQDADFTPDGELALVRPIRGAFRLELPADRVLLEAGWISHVRVSPDGASLACCIHATPSDDRGDLVVVPRTGGAARTIAQGWTSIDGIAWADDALWISASREGGNNSVRAIALDGHELEHVPSIGRVRVHDRARDGALAVTQVTGRLPMLVKPPSASTATDLGLADVSLVGAIARDGSHVAFLELGDVDTASGVYVRPTRGGPAVRLGDGQPLDLDHARGVLALRGGTLVAYPLGAGPPREISAPRMTVRTARWCGRDRVVIAGSLDGRTSRLWRIDAGQPTPLTAEGVAPPFSVDRDGSVLAFVDDGRLRVIDIERAAARDIAGTYTDEVACACTRDAVFVRTLPLPIRVRRIDLATGATTPVLEVMPPSVGLRSVAAFALADTGEAFAYSYGQELSRLFRMEI